MLQNWRGGGDGDYSIEEQESHLLVFGILGCVLFLSFSTRSPLPLHRSRRATLRAETAEGDQLLLNRNNEIKKARRGQGAGTRSRRQSGAGGDQLAAETERGRMGGKGGSHHNEMPRWGDGGPLRASTRGQLSVHSVLLLFCICLLIGTCSVVAPLLLSSARIASHWRSSGPFRAHHELDRTNRVVVRPHLLHAALTSAPPTSHSIVIGDWFSSSSPAPARARFVSIIVVPSSPHRHRTLSDSSESLQLRPPRVVTVPQTLIAMSMSLHALILLCVLTASFL
ncbi:hypothetical protein B0H14DRAFT_3873090, partial [Mycena olivaceomarginata]